MSHKKGRQGSNSGARQNSDTPQRNRTKCRSDAPKRQRSRSGESVQGKSPLQERETRIQPRRDRTYGTENGQESTAVQGNSTDVPTLFVSAAGKPITVSESSLQVARARMNTENGQESTAVQGNSTDVPTLFVSAAGKPITVSESSLQVARARMNTENGQESTAVQGNSTDVPTLFVSAAGKPITVSESSLQVARARMNTENGQESTAVQGNSTDVPTLFVSAAGKPITVSESSLQVASANAASSAKPISGAGASLSKRTPRTHRKSASSSPLSSSNLARKPFVVPFAKNKGAVAKGVGEAVPSASHMPSSEGEGSEVGRTPRHLSFDIFTFRSLSMTVPPSIDEIVRGNFLFKQFGCSPELLKLLEIPAECEFIPSANFRKAMLTLGASPRGCPDAWCLQMLTSTLLKLRGLTLHIDPPLPVFSVAHTLLHMCFKYNHEYVEGKRPALRLIAEGDVQAASLVVVWVVSVSFEERLTPHTCTAVVSDGFYHVKVSLDIPLTNLVRNGTLRCGQKIVTCGARMLRRDCCSPLECKDEVLLSINYNCTQPVGPSSPLGLYHTCLPTLLPSAMDMLGGLVPCLKGRVERVLPPFFLEKTFKGARTGDTRGSTGGALKIVRSLLAQLSFQECMARGAVAPFEGKSDRQLSRLTSFLLSCERQGDVLLQIWDDCGANCPAGDLEEHSCDFPPEGAEIVVFSVTPSRFRPGHPFQRTTVLYSRSPLRYSIVSPPRKGFVRQPLRSAEDVSPKTETGDAIDFAGLFVGTKSVDTVNSHIIVALNDGWKPGCVPASYFMIDVPHATGSKEIVLALPSIPFTPVIVQNASFIRCAEDLGPDCIHVLANEYTKVYSRPAEPLLRGVVESLGKIRGMAKSSRPIIARSEELLRMRTLSEEARADICRLSRELVGGDELPNPAVTAQSSPRYQLRQEASTPVEQSITISETSAARTLSSEEEQVEDLRSSNVKASPRRHVFGNIVGFRLLKCQGSDKPECIEILGGRPSTLVSGSGKVVVSPSDFSQSLVYFEADIQFGATAKQCAQTKVRSPSVLHSLLEQCIPLKRACALTVDEIFADYYLARIKQLEDWQTPHEECWWRLLTQSHVVEITSDASGTPPEELVGLQWLSNEWKMLLNILSGSLKHCLFMFSVEGSEMVRATFIKEQCSVADLMRE
ncbi:hypothetical protein, conserved [Trypanosoma brucei gambiense DAL972]|uniref:BRCA2 OB1 domain-containing protein n=1 Tax=Trypanosoma brucei gambiense (strain MHOM/CI/86/DAL972) TaxID=679716 RepID=C9ZHU4_TRYB9|nr:hypothetical protein, conserved [Trypanosoma brucei gambiense DAL972]CBH08815.1 hypothetical protein, conserved [Trypanosoma brucei gambiense DAL972]|eukprot:XP_011771256.1 hypothetical protein, conserved [Trypanosoma brucei gambiense DAL972]